MKILIHVLTIIIFFTNMANADYLKDVEDLGYVVGEGIACNAPKHRGFEFVSRAYIVSAAKTDREQVLGMQKFNEAKALAYLKNRQNNYSECARTIETFANQGMLKTKVYPNGKLVMPDGKIIMPRKEYDVRFVYDKNTDERKKLEEIYNKNNTKAQNYLNNHDVFAKVRKMYEKKSR